MRYIVTFFIITFAINCYSESLSVGKNYRLKTDLSVKEKTGENPNQYKIFRVGKYSRFEVLKVNEDGSYQVVFTNIYLTFIQSCRVALVSGLCPADQVKNTKMDTGVTENVPYLISADSNFGVDIEAVVKPASPGVVSGPLVVPFKYRFDDESLSGEATIGYYAGFTFDISLQRLSSVSFTPFLSAGLTQVGVSSIDQEGNINETNKTGVTIAAGLFVNNWDKVNIGLVWGQDRIGDKSWEHEGDDWISLSVGWEL